MKPQATQSLSLSKSFQTLGQKFAALLSITTAFALASSSPTPCYATELVDLHAHLFMPEASGLPFMGGFDNPLQATQWSDRLKTRVNAEALEKSGVKVAVVALYSHPLFPRSALGRQRGSIRHQISEAVRFVSTHPEWVIARTPVEARQALSKGRRVLIFAIEGVSGILENEADIREFVDTLGVRIVTPLHFSDDSIGGATFMPGLKILVNPIAALRSFFSPKRDSTGVRVNSQGLTEKGRGLIASLIQHGVWIDLTHASDASVRDMIPLLKEARQPLLYTHTILREDFQAERGISKDALNAVSESRGIVGLLSSDDMLAGTKVNPAYCPTACDGQCEGGIAAFATQYDVISHFVPAQKIFFGSDVDAPMTFLKPGCEKDRVQQPRGYWNYAQLPLVYQYLHDHHLTPDMPENELVEEFLKTWERAVGNRLKH